MKSRRAALAATLALAVVLTACSGLPFGGGPETYTSTVAPQTPPPGMEGAEQFYAQRLVWKKCGRNECTRLKVPIDYAEPDGATIELAVLRVPAGSQSKRLGALVVNPGGPGGSGVDYALGAKQIVGSSVRKVFDVVGFDPRGVARSAPIRCLDDRELDAMIGADPTPDDASEQARLAASAEDFAQQCAANGGPLLAHVSTVEVAKDVDVLRAALGDAKLNYLGKSYGTSIGATYAELFPQLVGRFVLDGVVAPELSTTEQNAGQAKGFESATREWAAYCVEDEPPCPLGGSVDEVMRGMRQVLQNLDGDPVPKTGDRNVTSLTEGWATIGIAGAMYDPRSSWDDLVRAMSDLVQRRDGTRLMKLADSYADRLPGGRYSGNLMQVIYAVNCLDRGDTADIGHYAETAEELSSEAPTWAPYLTWSSLPCGFWPYQPATAPTTVSAEGSGLIVVVGTTRDPATPYEWSLRLHDQLANSTLITFDGNGHTAYKSGRSSCVDKPIDRYFVRGTPPPADLRC